MRAIYVMQFLEARACADRIKEDPAGRPLDVKEFKERKGWISLHYTSWKKCSEAEFGGFGLKPKPVKPKPEERPKRLKTSKENLLEWVRIIDALAEENGGLLPAHKTLEKRRLFQVRHIMYNNPELFKHVKQERKNNRGVVIGYTMDGEFYPLEPESKSA